MLSGCPMIWVGCRQVATLRGGISKLLHQSWKSKEIPTSWEAWPESWKENHPDWGYILWTPHDNDLLASLMSPMLKSLYQRMPQVSDGQNGSSTLNEAISKTSKLRMRVEMLQKVQPCKAGKKHCTLAIRNEIGSTNACDYCMQWEASLIEPACLP